MEVVYKYSYVLTDDMKEWNSGDIITVPDQSYTVREILEKFVSGIDLDVSHKAYYDSDEISDLNHDLDVSERCPDFDLADYSARVRRVNSRKDSDKVSHANPPSDEVKETSNIEVDESVSNEAGE